ncbi:MAG TPA: peptide-methionine (S)-S-oxide reductase MsrA [Thermoanaerobaculia bacterium]|nr:peptide-methionine (S)-S-oxide reductase MsrA [Thermoanaerobaculia bacterium]
MDLTCEIPRVPPHEFPDPQLDVVQKSGEQSIVLGGGCFWCVEAVLKEMDGVLSVRSGYAGGTAETADYESVCTGRTDHAEVIEVRFDPARVSLGQILKVFFSVAHDPTQLNRQGADRGRQYRSAIFTMDEEQARVAAAYIRQLDEANVLAAPIVTEVAPLEKFYEAELYHQDYAARNPRQPYIQYTAAPKVAKLRKHFADKLKR